MGGNQSSHRTKILHVGPQLTQCGALNTDNIEQVLTRNFENLQKTQMIHQRHKEEQDEEKKKHRLQRHHHHHHHEHDSSSKRAKTKVLLNRNDIDEFSPSSIRNNERILKQKTNQVSIQYPKSPDLKIEPKKKLEIRKSQSLIDLKDGQHSSINAKLNSNEKEKLINFNQRFQSKNDSLEKSSSSIFNHQLTLLTNNQQKIISKNLDLFLIDSNEIRNIQEIGKGNFGTVYQAIYKNKMYVALKTLHSNKNSSIDHQFNDYNQNMDELLNEARTMAQLNHGNLLRFHGVTFYGEKQKLSLVTDFMENGSLLNYLKNPSNHFLQLNSKKSKFILNSFSKQIFQAMIYLEKRDIVHRDLAARNCLIGENNILKVGDFGLTRLTECGLYRGSYRSICAPRWTSPEAIFESKYSSRSDVWSYGITLWEIYSLGERPFGPLNNTIVKKILNNPTENLSRHLPKPIYCHSDEIYTHIILSCLTYNLTIRPRFRDLKERIHLIFN